MEYELAECVLYHMFSNEHFFIKVYIFCQNLFIHMNDRFVMDVFIPVGVFLSEQSVVLWCTTLKGCPFLQSSHGMVTV